MKTAGINLRKSPVFALWKEGDRVIDVRGGTIEKESYYV